MFWTSLGYAQYGSDRRLEYLMRQPRTLLIDLRDEPYSDYVSFDCTVLQEQWKKRYRRAGAYLGNVNHATDGDICIPRLREGLEVLLQYLTEGWILVLLCGCMNFHECHRATVVFGLTELLQQHKMLDYASSIVEDTPEPGMINCISIKQPWAQILVRARFFEALEQPPKEIENRTWTTPWRGPLAIHAGGTFDTGLFKNKMLDPIFWQDRFGQLSASVIPLHKDEYDLGAIIGTADLVDVVTQSESPWYVPGHYGFVLKNIRQIDPIPWRGKPRLFQVPHSVVSERISLRSKI